MPFSESSEGHDGAPNRRQFVRLDPTLNTGHILQLLLIAGMGIGMYGTYQADKTADKLEVAQIKRDADGQRTAVKESLADLRGDVKDVQRTLVEVNQSLAVLKARQPEQRLQK